MTGDGNKINPIVCTKMYNSKASISGEDMVTMDYMDEVVLGPQHHV